MSRYTADPDRIQDLVDNARRVSEQAARQLSEVDDLLNTLDVHWEGAAADDHRAAHDTWNSEFRDMSTALIDLEHLARAARERYLANVSHNRSMWP